jgi:hypothetical protein
MNKPPSHSGFPIARNGRLALNLWASFLIAGFSACVWLQPDTRGFGTHEQFGWAACSFESSTGWHCPSCGMTTSFSHFIRGQWLRSFKANTTGFFMALFCAIQIPWSLISARKGRLMCVKQPHIALLFLLAALYILVISEYLIREW